MDETTTWSIIKWLIGIIGALLVGIYTDLRVRVRATSKELAEKVTKKEFEDYKKDRLRRDNEVNRKLDKIDETTTRTHERIDRILERMK